MAIQSVQLTTEPKNPSLKQKKEHLPYLEAEGTISTENLVKPLPPKGHLIHDSIGNSIKYYFKDIAYDMKSLKNGFNGTANDHQLGRLNDVGLKLGGIGIAAYLASRTKTPKVRLMEYVGLITFLTAMSVYPKIAINTPAKVINGFDIDKEYIDDQGRKKSVMQDGNYVPFDMYLGEIKEEDLDAIGDAMGVPKNIKNRHEVVREQMRKVSVQNNTLWMLTAGFATPLMTALACCGFEYLVSDGAEKYNNNKYNKLIDKLSKKLSETKIEDVESNDFGKNIAKILKEFKGKEIPESEYKYVISLITENLDANVSEGIKADLEKILRTSANNGLSESFVMNSDIIEEMVSSIKNAIPKHQRKNFESELVPPRADIEALIKKVIPEADLAQGTTVSVEKLTQLRDELSRLLDSTFAKASGVPKEAMDAVKHDAIDEIIEGLRAKKSLFLSEKAYNDIVSFADIIGEFKNNQKVLDSCKSFKFEQAPETIIARSYGKFEKAFLKELGITYKDLRRMRDSSDFTMEILDKKITELCKDETRYNKTIEKLGKIIAEMEVNLNGSGSEKSYIVDLIKAIEDNYNIAAKRLNRLGVFSFTIDRMVKENVDTLGNSVTTREALFDFLDGIQPNKFKGYKDIKDNAVIDEIRKGLGSSKNLEISRILDRYNGSRNSFFRVIQTLDFYKRAINYKDFDSIEEVAKLISEIGKETLLCGTTTDQTMKLNTVNAQEFYKRLMNAVYNVETEAGTKSKGFLTSSTKDSLKSVNNIENGSILDRLQYYIAKFGKLFKGYDVDFTKPKHIEGFDAAKEYTQRARTRMSMFNLVAQSPVDMARGAADRRYGNLKWLRMVGGITAAVFGVTILAQFGFGKLSNPHNLKKQVQNETDK